ncbi:MAG: alpha-amylase, partial [Tannerella sp.]|nr:alpha-amylase [Tannerella sp.]
MEKIVIYQTLPRLFGNRDVPMRKDGSIAENGSGKFADYTPAVLDAIRELGATHIWYTGILSHATTTDYASYGLPHDHPAVVKGKAGSPYAIRDYYDLDPDLAVNVGERMAEFQALVERSHRAGMKVIIDFVANHVARQYHSTAKPSYVEDLGQGDDTSMAFSSQNNFYYIPNQPLILQFATPDTDFPYSEFPAKATGNDHFDAYPHKDDWYETVKLNYGIDYRDGHKACLTPRPNTWDKMLDILSFWADKGVDGFRCDMAGMVPVAFWAWAIPQLKSRHQLLFIAELYEPATYRAYLKAGFDCLYDKVGLYDTLREVVCGRAPASRITSAWQQVDGIQGQMLAFLENH